jgi:hypothetical protein
MKKLALTALNCDGVGGVSDSPQAQNIPSRRCTWTISHRGENILKIERMRS